MYVCSKSVLKTVSTLVKGIIPFTRPVLVGTGLSQIDSALHTVRYQAALNYVQFTMLSCIRECQLFCEIVNHG